MCVLILLCGMATLSWYAWLAFRTRVSMSAIGSVMVMEEACGLSRRGSREGLRRRGGYQLDLVTPGSWPAWAISRTQMRQRPNARKTARGRPQRLQRV